MILPDVNVLLAVFHPDAAGRDTCSPWFENLQASGEPFAVSTNHLASVVRLATNPKVLTNPAALHQVIDFCAAILTDPCCRHIEPGPHHFAHFASLCIASKARGNLVTDAWIAALALEHGCTIITFDKDFRKFPGLKVSAPLIGG